MFGSFKLRGMKANELRIGNLVHCILLGTSKVLELRNDGISICSPDNNLNAYFIPNKDLHRLELIPLTEEWLLKMGGVKLLGDEWNYRLSIGAIYIRFRVYKTVYSDLEGIYLGQHIQYVHQLQNLYFALTGEELTIK